MPHIVLEYTDDIPVTPDFNSLFADLHQVLVNEAGINIRNCKSRAIKLDNYFIGDEQSKNSFIHLAVRTFSGRSDDIKMKIGEKLRQVLVDYFAQSTGDDVQITVEIEEIDKRFYFKFP